MVVNRTFTIDIDCEGIEFSSEFTVPDNRHDRTALMIVEASSNNAVRGMIDHAVNNMDGDLPADWVTYLKTNPFFCGIWNNCRRLGIAAKYFKGYVISAKNFLDEATAEAEEHARDTFFAMSQEEREAARVRVGGERGENEEADNLSDGDDDDDDDHHHQGQVALLEETIQQLRADLDAANAEKNAALADLNVAIAANAQMGTTIQQGEANIATLEERIQVLTVDLDAAMADLDAANTDLAVANADLDVANAANDQLTMDLAASNNNNRRLSDENTQLRAERDSRNMIILSIFAVTFAVTFAWNLITNLVTFVLDLIFE